LALTDDGEALSLGRLDGLLGFQLRMASAAMARDFAAAMADLGLTQKQCAVLELIATNAGVSQVDMAARLGMDRATMMALVDRLDARGLLVRTASRRDRRRQELSLTTDGKALLREARGRIAAHERPFVDRLGPAKAERLVALLREIYA
jgi:DNA-binding MarR family transcriptional regulator